MRRRGDDDSPASLHQRRMRESTLDRRGEKMPECIRCEASLYGISKESERLRQNIIYTDRIRSEDTTGIVSHIKSRTHGSESKTPTCPCKQTPCAGCSSFLSLWFSAPLDHRTEVVVALPRGFSLARGDITTLCRRGRRHRFVSSITFLCRSTPSLRHGRSASLHA